MEAMGMVMRLFLCSQVFLLEELPKFPIGTLTKE